MKSPVVASRFDPLHAAAWSFTWALGVGAGVATGAYLTVAADQSAPGLQALGASELLVLPSLAAVATFVLSFIGRLAISVVRPSDAGPSHESDAEKNGDHGDDVGRI